MGHMLQVNMAPNRALAPLLPSSSGQSLPCLSPVTASRLGSLGEARRRAQALGRVVRMDPGRTLQGPAQQTDALVTGCSLHIVCDGRVVSCTLLQSMMN